MITRDYIHTAVRYMVRDVMADDWWRAEEEIDWTAVEQRIADAVGEWLDADLDEDGVVEDGCVDREHRWAVTALELGAVRRMDVDEIAKEDGHGDSLWRGLARRKLIQEVRGGCYSLAHSW